MTRVRRYSPTATIIFGVYFLFGVVFLGYLLFKSAPFFIIGLTVGIYIFIFHHKDLFEKQIAYGLFLSSVVVVFFHICYFFSSYGNNFVGYVAFFILFCAFCAIVDYFHTNPYQEQHNEEQPQTQAEPPKPQPKQPPKTEPIQKTEQPTPPPKYLLPFPLKTKPTLIVNPTLYGDFEARELAVGIVKCSATYLKQQLKSITPFEIIDPKIIMPHLSKMYDANDMDLSIVNGVGTAIHQCVWKLMISNTGIDSREYLPFGGNYHKYLAELLGDFGEVPITTGIQIYTESLIDYYLSKLR